MRTSGDKIKAAVVNLLLYPLPDDPRHLIAIELHHGILDVDLLVGQPDCCADEHEKGQPYHYLQFFFNILKN